MNAKSEKIISRFGFGKNWSNFLKILNEDRINQAKESLQNYMEMNSFSGLTFLDVGSGSGLFSLAAMKLGAKRVHSFDYDHQSVECTKELKRRYFPNSENWTIERGDALDPDYLKSLKEFDVVYSWGVLHHTGNMYLALNNVASLVNKGGYLYIAIYNDQGGSSKRWKKIKKLYNSSNKFWKWVIVACVFIFNETRAALIRLIRLQNPLPFKYWKDYNIQQRGMSHFYDLIDWVGGYPFEVAKPEQIFHCFKKHGFTLINLRTGAGSLGCNEFLFKH